MLRMTMAQRAVLFKTLWVAHQDKILLVEDNAGWHSSKKAIIPEGIEIDFLPPYSRLVTASRKVVAQLLKQASRV